jgi:hypothetical protein
MKQPIFTAILLLAFCFATFAQVGTFLPVGKFITKYDEVMVFDDFGKLPLREQKARLDNLFHTLANDENLISFIEFRLDKNESRKRKIKRFKAISEHFNRRSVNKSRFTLVFIEGEEERTTIWAQPQDAGFTPISISERALYKLFKADKLEEKINELFPKK